MSGQPSSCIGCALYGKSAGFVLGSGDPTTAKIAIMGEAPGREELLWRVDEAEVSRRRQRYPEMEEKFLRTGAPFVGKSGGLLFSWGLGAVQLTRNDIYVDNCLRCLPPKIKDSQYPIGDERKAAEAHCRIYDRWNEFKPSVNLIQIHPAAIAREPSPLPLFVKTFEKSKHFHLGGERPLVLCGGKAVQMWLGYGSTIQSWLGHYASETFFSASNRERRRVEGMAIKVGEKKVRKKKLTIRGVLEEIVKATVPFQVQTGDVVGQEVTVRWTEEEYKEIAALFVSKVKKV